MFQRTLQQTTWQMSQDIGAIRTKAPLPYLLITLELISLEKVSVSDVQTRKTVS